jgi:hypothetical protein
MGFHSNTDVRQGRTAIQEGFASLHFETLEQLSANGYTVQPFAAFPRRARRLRARLGQQLA